MEYTLARMVMAVGGVLMLAAVISPVSSVYENGESSEMQEQAESICRMFEAFSTSEADEVTLNLNTILPNGTSVTMSGHFVTLLKNDNEYRYATECLIDADKEYYDGNDCIRMTKDGRNIRVMSL